MLFVHWVLGSNILLDILQVLSFHRSNKSPEDMEILLLMLDNNFLEDMLEDNHCIFQMYQQGSKILRYKQCLV